ncbi:hypothetical protein [Chitinophaga sp. YIM B06452]|uniref:hypothetical protein n=1 Tax=Chitinophaga sp. YIM B06452 TaxID=3082158 RepID=UPI0031FEB67E
MYQIWQQNGVNAGSFGYTSSDAGIRLYNAIGDIILQTTAPTGTLKFYTGNAYRMYIAQGGNVGIGTTSPTAKLTVDGDIHGKRSLFLKTNSVNSTELIFEKPNLAYYSITSNNSSFNFYNHSTQKIFLHADAQDNIGIGTTETHGNRLAVAGNILAEKVKVKLQVNWPDFVFNPGYKTPSVPELENFVRTHKHLPGVPSAADVAEKGLDLGSNQAALLQKIEELTLIIIDQHKKIEAQEKRLTALEKK